MSLIPEFRRAAFGLFEHPFLRHGPFLLPRRAHLRQWMEALETPEGGWIKADVREEAGADGRGVFVVEAEVPGAKKSDVNVEFQDGGKTLTVSAKVDRTVRSDPDGDVTGSAPETGPPTERAQATARTTGPSIKSTGEVTTAGPGTAWHSFERSFGLFSRSFTFAEPVDAGSTTASYEDGVVKVVVPKLSPRPEVRQTVRVD